MLEPCTWIVRFLFSNLCILTITSAVASSKKTTSYCYRKRLKQRDTAIFGDGNPIHSHKFLESPPRVFAIKHTGKLHDAMYATCIQCLCSAQEKFHHCIRWRHWITCCTWAGTQSHRNRWGVQKECQRRGANGMLQYEASVPWINALN